MEKNVSIKNASGLHARPAGMFVKKASEFTSTVEVLAKGKTVNAKSILSMFKFSLILSVIIFATVSCTSWPLSNQATSTKGYTSAIFPSLIATDFIHSISK